MTPGYALSERPLAAVLGGFDRVDEEAAVRKNRLLRIVNDGDEIALGTNKFLFDLGGKPMYEWVLDAVQGSGRYAGLVAYNDVEEFRGKVDLRKYPTLDLRQMTGSVGGHLLDLYHSIEYGQRVDIFFADTPRATPELVRRVNDEYTRLFGRTDSRGNPVRIAFGFAPYEEAVRDNWLPKRTRLMKDSYFRFSPWGLQMLYDRHVNGIEMPKFYFAFKLDGKRVYVHPANHAAFIKHPTNDAVAEHKMIDYLYSMRKGIADLPRIIGSMAKHHALHLIPTVALRFALPYERTIDDLRQVMGGMYGTDLSETGLALNFTRTGAAFENDIDSVVGEASDLAVFRRKAAEGKLG
ncbi:hypothetical protein JXB02_05005 [Candidatus Woesearchaeota archaeon]|nr:hypothetical protein [Candidatus Woesearchaeota archaeon]